MPCFQLFASVICNKNSSRNGTKPGNVVLAWPTIERAAQIPMRLKLALAPPQAKTRRASPARSNGSRR